VRSAILASTLWMTAALVAQTVSSPISADPPADPANPALLVEIAVPSHGAQLLGRFIWLQGLTRIRRLLSIMDFLAMGRIWI
jgi:hypothetical protein